MRPPESRVIPPLIPRSSSQSQQTTFTAIFQTNAWGGGESVSGPGSSQARGEDFRHELVALLDAWDMRAIVDAPCGDFNWMRHFLADRPLSYTGVDIVEALIARNVERHASPDCHFVCADLTRADLPRADLIICRDGLVHLSFADASAAIDNFRRSGSRYLLATTFIDRTSNDDVPTGGWRPLNLQCAPFDFPAPLALVDERCLHTGGIYRDKRLGLWELG
jgi:hypothetical protein